MSGFVVAAPDAVNHIEAQACALLNEPLMYLWILALVVVDADWLPSDHVARIAFAKMNNLLIMEVLFVFCDRMAVYHYTEAVSAKNYIRP